MGKRILLSVCIFCACAAAAWAGQGAYDVSAFSLNGLSIDNRSGRETLTFDVAARRSADFEIPLNIQKATERTIEYFFIGLAMPDDAFWVNLNPQGMTKIMEEGLSETDLGKVMLAADLRLKKDTCELTNPQRSKVGHTYWDRLYAKADELGIVDQIPVYNRVWIVPGDVRLSRTQNRISIAHSSLQVCFEADVFANQAPAADARAKELQDYAGQLMREMILPELNKKVNESRSYEDLRQVYNALILARAYKQRALLATDAALRGLNAETVLADVSRSLPLDKNKIYKDYIKSLRNGEYNFQEDVSGRLNFYMEVITRQYMSGGIDIRTIEMSEDAAAGTESQPSSQRDIVQYSFEIELTKKDIARPLAAVRDRLARRFSSYNAVSKNSSEFQVDNLPPVEPVSEGSQISPFSGNLEIMLRHL